MKVVLAAVIVALVTMAASIQATGTGRAVIIVHGWNPNDLGQARWDEVYGILYDHLVEQGYDVHGPMLPATGNDEGDSIINAEFLQDYIETNGLSDVVLVGHSLGGVVVEYYVRLLDQGEVGDYAILDSSIQSGGAKGATCVQFPPDLCSRSSVLGTIFDAPAREDIFLLNVWAEFNGEMSHVDCSIKVRDSHEGMVSNSGTLAAIGALMAQEDPCAGSSSDGGTGDGGGPGKGGGNGGGPKNKG